MGLCRKTAACRRARLESWQNATGRRAPKAKRGCKVPGCLKSHYGHGYCMMHWARVRKTGEPGPAEPMRPVPTVTAGDTFGRWTALEDYHPGMRRRIRCRCLCGTEKAVIAESLWRGATKSCGCGRRKDGLPSPPRKQRRDGAPYLAAGTIHGYLTVLEDVMFSADQVRCQCACGVITKKLARLVKNRRTRSCGCLQATVRTTHGLSGHPLYGIWHGIIQRTTKPGARSYPDYGGRGITICDRWRDVAVFIEDIERDIGKRPAGHSLDRIDVQHGNYEPGAVRWAPPEVQTRNRRTVKDLEREIAELRAQNAALKAQLSQ
jgi:hypothetical protein